MDLLTKDLLINFLFILLSLFLMQMIYLFKYVYRLEKSRRWPIAVFTVMSVVLCMLIPVATENNFVWDLRWIPFILGTLYGGYRLGLLLLGILLFIRLFTGGMVGFYIACFTFPLIGLLGVYVSKYYVRMTIKQKVSISIALTLLGLGCSIIISRLFFANDMEMSFWAQYSIIHIIGMSISTLLLEVILTNFRVLQNLVKAEKLQTVSHLAASISHEVRNPLTASRGFIQLLSDDISEEARKQYVDIALQELDRATEVINDYLTFAKPTLDMTEQLNISEEIQRAVKVIMPLANMNAIEIQLSLLPEDPYFVRGERKKFQQGLINILKNGIESMPNNKSLRINQTYYNNIIQINIHDEGTGMTQEQINRLGEPYFTTKEKGTGLGLMVSYSIVKAMGGTVLVTSEQGKGTCFSLRLPIIQESEQIETIS
jgi:two-component system, sporulation sensor kinase B